MKKVKRIISAMLVLAMMLTFAPISQAAQTYVITGKNTVTVPVAGYEVGTRHTNCWEFAQTIYQKIWGTGFSSYRGTSDDMLRNVGLGSARAITAQNTKRFISAAPLGSVIRISTVMDGNDNANTNYQHSQILIQKDANGFTVYEGNVPIDPVNDPYGQYIRIKYFTWSDYAKGWANWQYFKYIKYPNATAFDVGPHTCDKGTFAGAGDTHPHNSYWYCSLCGANWREWDSVNYLSSCSECLENHTCDKGTFAGAGDTHPHDSYWYCSICGANWREWWSPNYLESCEECRNHTCDKGTWLYFGLSHPHCDYYKCSLCGKEWMDSESSNYYSSCSQCVSTTYTLTYNANGGTGAPSAQTANKNSAVTVSSVTPSRDGLEFGWWNTKEDGSGDVYEAGDSIVLSSDITLYAMWVKVPYTVDFDPNGGDVSPDSFGTTSDNPKCELPTPTKYVTITYNANGGKNAPSATKAYYECLGWSKSSTATTATYKCGEQYNITGGETLYAVWANKAYTDLSSSVPTRDGYKFLGWATSSSATQAQFAPGINVNLGIDTTLYAVWQKVETPTPPTPPAPTVTYENVSLNYKDNMTFNVPVTLETSDSGVASVSGSKISAVGTGSADVTVTFEDGSVCVYHVNVSYAWWQWIIIIVLFGWAWY
ncbi:MAG: InlB B-repeat-containing protein [Clostridia bacterium]|nr:InlB B-repeat-containing protein [Clostridia bacterium]